MYSANLLMEARKELKVNSYTEMGIKTYGKAGKIAVDIGLVFS